MFNICDKVLNMDKQQSRKLIEKRQKELTSEYLENASKDIMEQLMVHPYFKKAKLIFTYINSKYEPATLDLIKYCLNHNIRVAVPLCVDDNHIEAKLISSLDQCYVQHYGLLEPSSNCLTIKKDNIDLIIVPCVSCNEKGERLGHGRGYYDNYLQDYKGNKIMLGFKELSLPNIPMAHYDVPVKDVIMDR